MQSLISPVDHESRHNSYNRDYEQATERTPLLTESHVYIRTHQGNNIENITYIIVLVLAIFLLSGVVISVYLLFEQEDPLPLEKPFQLWYRSYWKQDDERSLQSILSYNPEPAYHIIVVQTNTDDCYDTKQCSEILRQLDLKYNETDTIMPYNFLISSDGTTYEGLGWYRRIMLFPEITSPSIVLAFIGNYESKKLTKGQIIETRVFIDEALSRGVIANFYTIIGKRYNGPYPKQLFKSISHLKGWDIEHSDS